MLSLLMAVVLLALPIAASRGSYTTTAAAATTATGTASADNTLTGTVGPGFTISLQKDGADVTTLPVGTYSFVISDQSTNHNFALVRPDGTLIALTTVNSMGSITVTVELTAGTWGFKCQPHEATMNGSFTVIQASSGEPTRARLSVTIDGSGAGSVISVPAGVNCGATCGAYFAIGSTVTLTATAASGSVYTGWSGGCSGASSTCVVTFNAATSVTATFGVASAATSATATSGVAVAFKVLSVMAGSTALRSRVTLPGPGVFSLSARSIGSNRVGVCAVRKKVSRASSVLLLCPFTGAAKRALLHRSLRVQVITTFTPTGGVAQVHTKIIKLGARGRVCCGDFGQ